MTTMRERKRLELVVALDDEHQALQDAKAAHAEQRTPESRAAKRQAMASYAETRAWIRAKRSLETLPGRIEAARRTARQLQKATDPEAVARRDRAAAQADQLEAKLERIRRDFGPLVEQMNQLAAAASGKGGA